MNTRTKKGKAISARKRTWERKLRHQLRAELQKAIPRVREGKPLNDLDDERKWMAELR